ncbi:uncharacterized protein TRIADDRAFT_53403 [Trichoplax adhaerens]|uniref:Uncharacterized protein n=1 Tax=Trichoplax adhaerens TaxID=10228 RepID=B3RP48_TRIAD|nr:predicted protein [Trichoplax adhaerens]EDV28128.1 predicted protein [Trichoplax adhaerens]|eukprot:XP_002109962.1 predicted protein [Trichoplax adhaerens]
MDNDKEMESTKPEEKRDTIPGFFTSLNNWYCMSKLQHKGHLFFHEEQQRHKRSIFRVNLGYDAIAILTNEESQLLFDSSKVAKEDCYGIALQNVQSLTNYPIASLWSDQAKKDRKSLINDVVQLIPVNYFIKVVSDTIKEHFQRWEDKYEVYLGNGPPGNWERDIQEFCSNAISSLLLGTRVEFQSASDCLEAMLMISRLFVKTGSFNRGIKATKVLLQQIEQSPNFKKLAKIGECYSLTQDFVKINILYIMMQDKEHLIQSTSQVLTNHSGLSESAMLDMTDLKSFVMETLIANNGLYHINTPNRNDMNISVDGSTYNIRKGQRLLANLYWANRDPKWFDNPDEFQPFRFSNYPSLKRCLLWEYGCFGDEFEGLEENKIIPVRDVADARSLLFSAGNQYYVIKTTTTITRFRDGKPVVEVNEEYKSGQGKDGMSELKSVLKANDINESVIHTVNHSTTSNLGSAHKNVIIRKRSRKQKQKSTEKND